MKYENEVKQLLELLGGRDNITSITHCMTRLRLVLVDESIVDLKKIEALPSVKGSFTQAGQFQIIIGNDVATYFNDFSVVSGIDKASKDEVKEVAKSKQNMLQKAMSNMAEIFAPIIPAIIVGGLLLGFRNVLEGVKFYENGTKTIVELYPFWAGINHFLWLICEAIFHMLPVMICWSVVKKMRGTESLGIVLGLTLVSGQLLNAYAVAGGDKIPYWNFGSFKVAMIGYQAQVIPAILAAFVFVYLERWFRKVIPNAIAMIFVPMFSLVLAVIIAHTVVGPIGWQISNIISGAVQAGLTSSLRGLFAAVFGFLYAPTVITGLHHMSNAIDLELMNKFDGTILWPMIALSNIAQGSAVVGFMLMNRKNEQLKEVGIASSISCYLGVTEPAMFGVNIKYGSPFLAAMIGSSIAATYSVLMGVMAEGIGVGGLPGILSIKTEHMLNFSIAMLIAIVIPIILTVIFTKKGIAKVKDVE